MSSAAIERMVRVKELAEITGWSQQRIRRLVNHEDATKRIPHVRLGEEIHFLPSDIRAWQERNKRHAEVQVQEASARSKRRRSETYEEECERLGVAPNPAFATD